MASELATLEISVCNNTTLNTKFLKRQLVKSLYSLAGQCFAFLSSSQKRMMNSGMNFDESRANFQLLTPV